MGYPVVDQIDLVPTLSYFFGFPIPKNSLGKPILDFYQKGIKDCSSNTIRLRNFIVLDALGALKRNAVQLGNLLEKLIPEISRRMAGEEKVDVGTLGYDYIRAKELSKHANTAKQAEEHYYKVRLSICTCEDSQSWVVYTRGSSLSCKYSERLRLEMDDTWCRAYRMQRTCIYFGTGMSILQRTIL